MKIVDCFIFHDELDLLAYRFAILNGVVDYFVLVEATRTFTGDEKPLHYAENKKLFEEFNPKIVHVVVDDFPFTRESIDLAKKEHWLNETCQRNAISRGLARLTLAADDVVLVTDVDEIPDRRMLTSIKKGAVKVSLNVLEMDMYCYNLRTKCDAKWPRAKIIRRDLLTMACDDLRQYHGRPHLPRIPNGGWHLSYFENNHFSQEHFTDGSKIEKRISSDLYDLKQIDLNCNPYLPLEYEVYLKQFV